VPHRILERNDLLHGLGHLFDASRIEGQSVQEGIARAARSGLFDIASVGGNQARHTGAKARSQLA
jgi:hypothetical protein